MDIRRVAITAVMALAFGLSFGSGASAVGPGKQCGGIIGIPCDKGLWCQMPAGSCRAFDMFGTCVRVPQLCPRIFRPVCGCDGKTYSNDCIRRHAKVQLAHQGTCKPGPKY